MLVICCRFFLPVRRQRKHLNFFTWCKGLKNWYVTWYASNFAPMTKGLFTSSFRRLFSLNLNPKLFAACKSNYFGYLFFFTNRSWILPCHRTQSLFEILTITQHFHLSESNLHSVSLSLSRIHLTNSKGEKDVKMIAYSEQQWKGWRKTRRGKMSEKMKREEKLQSQQ